MRDVPGNCFVRDGFVFRQSHEALVLEGARISETCAYMQSRNLTRLEVNSSWYALNTLDPLLDFGFLTHLVVILHKQACSLKAINKLHSLTVLSLDTFGEGECDFTQLPRLSELTLSWGSGFESALRCAHLKYVLLDGFSARDVTPLGSLMRLETLGLSNSSQVSLAGLERHQNLHCVGLVLLRRLTDPTAIRTLSKLEYLRIDTCRRLENVEFLRGMPHVRELHLDGLAGIASLEPLASLPALEVLTFDDNTKIIDGDVAILRTFPKLKKVNFFDRKSYNASLADIRTFLTMRA